MERLTDETAASRLLTPVNLSTGKEPRYYQQIAINAAVQSMLQGKRRVLLTMATGTGKTVVAFHICWKLWSTRWNRTGEPRRPRILFLWKLSREISRPIARDDRVHIEYLPTQVVTEYLRTSVTVDGKEAKIEEVKAGYYVTITPAEGKATSITATTTKPEKKKA